MLPLYWYVAARDIIRLIVIGHWIVEFILKLAKPSKILEKWLWKLLLFFFNLVKTNVPGISSGSKIFASDSKLIFNVQKYAFMVTQVITGVNNSCSNSDLLIVIKLLTWFKIEICPIDITPSPYIVTNYFSDHIKDIF